MRVGGGEEKDGLVGSSVRIMDWETEEEDGQGMERWDFVCYRRDVTVSVSVSECQ